MSNRNIVAAAPRTFGLRLYSPRSPGIRIVELLRRGSRGFSAWRRRCRERKKLYEFLASDRRAAADIGYPHRLE